MVSDHGFHPYWNPFDYNYPANRLLQALGYLERLPDGSIDYGQTRVFDTASNPWEAVRWLELNRQDRLPEGTIPSGAAAAVLAELASALEDLRTESGTPVITAVTVAENESGINVQFHEGLERDAVVVMRGRSMRIREIFPPRTLSGNHRPQGIVAFYGGGVTPGPLPSSSSLDMAPTILALLGHPVAEDMDGKPMTPLLQQLGIPVTTVATLNSFRPPGRRSLLSGSCTNACAGKARLRGTR